MKQVTTYVGIDAHKKDLFVAMLVGRTGTPVTWTVPNEPNAVRRLVRKLEREAPGPVQRLLRSRALRLCVAAPAVDATRDVPGDRARADSAQTW